MGLKLDLLSIKRGILLFWALWLSIVCATNVFDALRALGVLPVSWSFASGNYALVAKVVGIHAVAGWLAGVLFLGVMIWEGSAAFLFWRAFHEFHGLSGPGLRTVHTAFTVSPALWAAFMLADEVLSRQGRSSFYSNPAIRCWRPILLRARDCRG
jgi:hypothetical protein